MISGTALKKQLSAADVEQHQGILARAGRYLGQALSMPVGLLDMADVCVYGSPNIINATFIGAAPAISGCRHILVLPQTHGDSALRMRT